MHHHPLPPYRNRSSQASEKSYHWRQPRPDISQQDRREAFPLQKELDDTQGSSTPSRERSGSYDRTAAGHTSSEGENILDALETEHSRTGQS